MSEQRKAKNAAVRLGLEMAKRVEASRLAVGEDETISTATDLSLLFLENVDFIVWALRKVGGLSAGSPEPVSARSDALITLSPLLTGIKPS